MSNGSPRWVALALLVVLNGPVFESGSSEVDRWRAEQLRAGREDEPLRNYVLQHDLGSLWMATGPASVFGFLGDGYQRFQIHFDHVRRVGSSRDSYELEGKTRTAGRICSFRGTARIAAMQFFNPGPPYPPDDIRGTIVWEISISQDRSCSGSGEIGGVLVTLFYLDAGRPALDDRMSDGDGYSNNQCVAEWRAHDGKTVKRCHWGDDRIPLCDDLDWGAGIFMVNPRYASNGWQTYVEDRERDAQDRWWK